MLCIGVQYFQSEFSLLKGNPHFINTCRLVSDFNGQKCEFFGSAATWGTAPCLRWRFYSVVVVHTFFPTFEPLPLFRDSGSSFWLNHSLVWRIVLQECKTLVLYSTRSNFLSRISSYFTFPPHSLSLNFLSFSHFSDPVKNNFFLLQYSPLLCIFYPYHAFISFLAFA